MTSTTWKVAIILTLALADGPGFASEPTTIPIELGGVSRDPHVACGIHYRGCLVTWVVDSPGDHLGEIWGRLITGNGVPHGPDIFIGRSADGYGAEVIYNGVDFTCLHFRSTTPGFSENSIKTLTVTEVGAPGGGSVPEGGAIPLDDGPTGVYSRARLAINKHTSEMLAVWNGSSADDESVWGASVDAFGGLIGPTFAIDSGSPGRRTPPDPSVASNGTDFLVTYGDVGTDDARVFSRVVTFSATVSAATLLSNSPGFRLRAEEPEVAYGGGRYLVVWTDDGVRGRLVDSDGAPLGPVNGSPLLSGFQQGPAGVAWLGSYFLLAAASDNGLLHLRSVDSNLGLGADQTVSGAFFAEPAIDAEDGVNLIAFTAAQPLLIEVHGLLFTDGDGDGTGDDFDVCPDDPSNDSDGDGICGDVDNCPIVANSNQLDIDSDGLGDACDLDDDADGVPDTADNCPSTANPGQADFDDDGLGDFCDLDDDADGVLDGVDACPGTVPGAIHDASGCSIEDLVPCGSAWKNHGAYVKAVVEATRRFRDDGLLTSAQRDAAIAAAAETICGF